MEVQEFNQLIAHHNSTCHYGDRFDFYETWGFARVNFTKFRSYPERLLMTRRNSEITELDFLNHIARFVETNDLCAGFEHHQLYLYATPAKSVASYSSKEHQLKYKMFLKWLGIINNTNFLSVAPGLIEASRKAYTDTNNVLLANYKTHYVPTFEFEPQVNFSDDVGFYVIIPCGHDLSKTKVDLVLKSVNAVEGYELIGHRIHHDIFGTDHLHVVLTTKA